MPVVALLMLSGIAVLLTAFVYSRYVFGGYIKRAHPETWERLAGESEKYKPTWGASDVTDAMYAFRMGREDLGDERVRVLRRRAGLFYVVGALLAVGALIALVMVALVAAALRSS